mmetsp:Transcript_1060/g.1043  ORF Transcript_1060/g.1043 Transcript_1060/m.1043 type:complete len:100 (-) Transcript_1060:9-308(-)
MADFKEESLVADKNASSSGKAEKEEAKDGDKTMRKHIITLMHFNEQDNFVNDDKDGLRPKHFGVVDLKFHKKVIIGGEAEEDKICDIFDEVLERIKLNG